MDSKITDYFTCIVELANIHFESVQFTIDSTPKRSTLRLNAFYKNYKILVTELYSDQSFKYRYYVLKDQFVIAGFDNAPDPRAIRLKYGKIGQEHSGELIPHLHLEDKQELILTQEMNFNLFIDWLIKHHF
ncbi:hypothetical protein [Aphanothece sacrum]|uniref:16S rRNA methyltransferase n=1 Tax=Aphanothece sacrum FPU1 TaxID=1920663 RepID=A0A401IHY8_APHSA|nr:hypothetical protein [Aphanothece sacrum]GBF80806.1 16S rRNA methyltransferase [Aphanothece sacrum FPU1]GBF83301.1 16S rRNA methyltransferase [Aphanothece sacrum FPU3]